MIGKQEKNLSEPCIAYSALEYLVCISPCGSDDNPGTSQMAQYVTRLSLLIQSLAGSHEGGPLVGVCQDR